MISLFNVIELFISQKSQSGFACFLKNKLFLVDLLVSWDWIRRTNTEH